MTRIQTPFGLSLSKPSTLRQAQGGRKWWESKRIVGLLALCFISAAHSQVPDGNQALSAEPGDALRGRAIVANRQQSLCLLCHGAPIPEDRAQGNLAPPLEGVGSRLTKEQLRLRMIDSQKINPTSIMPPYFRADGLNRVATAHQGRTMLTAQQLEDVVAYLQGLK